MGNPGSSFLHSFGQSRIPHSKLFGNSTSLNSIVTELYKVPLYNLAYFITNLLILENIFLGMGVPPGSVGMFPKEGVWETGVGMSSSFKESSRILNENPLASKASQKNCRFVY
jgi:hypothetical protein